MAKVKICGLKTREAVEAALAAGADFIGLVHFPKSPRHVTLDEAADLASIVRGRSKIVVLLVNPDDALVERVLQKVSPDFIQLHGDETVADIEAIKSATGLPVIKALKVKTRQDVEQAAIYGGVADILLFDAKPPVGADLPGGNGIPFDWDLLKGFKTDRDYMLSGGLDPETVANAIEETGAPIVDVSSGVEKAPGIKDLDKIRQFAERAG